MGWQRRNYLVLAVFAPILIITGVLGLVLPASASPMSNAVPYDVFHIAFGLLGGVLVLAKAPKPIATFNLGFGLIDLWQAAANLIGGLFPADVFKLRPADDVLHVVIGLILVVVGAMGLREQR